MEFIIFPLSLQQKHTWMRTQTEGSVSGRIAIRGITAVLVIPKMSDYPKSSSPSKGDWKIQGKWFELAMSSSYPSSSYTWGSTVLFEFICNWQEPITQGHPTTVFCTISVQGSNNSLEFSIAWERIKISSWPFHSCSIFEAYVINSPQFSKVQIFAFQSPG